MKRQSAVLAQISHELVDSQPTQSIHIDQITKVLVMEWNTTLDTFRSMVSLLKQIEALTKRALLSVIAKLYDVMGWCSPTIVKPKVLLQHMWRENVIEMTLLPDASLQCGNDVVQKFMFYGNEKYRKGIFRNTLTLHL